MMELWWNWFMDLEAWILLGLKMLLVVGVFLVRNVLARILLNVVFSGMRKSRPVRYQLVRETLKVPVSYMLVTAAARFVSEFLNLKPRAFFITTNILSTLFLVTAFWALYSTAALVAGIIIEKSKDERSSVDPNVANYVSSAIRIVVVVVAVFSLLSRWVSDISGLVAGLGIGGLALALAAQDTASNLFGSLAIMLDKPFEIGDWIELDGVMGTVLSVGLRSSKIQGLDQSIISVPNSRLASATISNGTKRMSRRVSFTVGVVYSTPPARLEAYVQRIRMVLAQDPDVEDGTELVTFHGYAASSLDIQIIYHTLAGWVPMLHVRERINFAILRAAKEMGVSMAFPSISLYQERGSENPKEEPFKAPNE